MILLLVMQFVVTACDDDVMVSVKDINKSTTNIISISPQTIRPGGVVTLKGSNFSTQLQLKIAGTSIPLTILDDQNATFQMPVDQETGLWSLDFQVADKELAHFLMAINSGEAASFDNVPLASVCNSQQIKLADGSLVSGRARCASECTGDGEVGCVTTDTLRSAQTNGLSAKVISGQSVAGIAGTAAVRPADCTQDGATGCITNAAFPAADTLGFLATDIRFGITIAGVSGMLTGTPSPCGSDGEINCLTNAAFPSVQMSHLTAGVLKNGTVIAGVTGEYPSSAYPLLVNDGYGDIDAATFQAKIKSTTNFGWFDRNGTRFHAAGDDDIDASKIQSGVTVFGTTGTFGPPCSSDGQSDCVTTSRYKSMDTDSNVISGWDLRYGKTAGGIAGQLRFNRNASNLNVYNRVVGTASSSDTSIPDPYDMIDDYAFHATLNPTGTFPTGVPADQTWFADVSSWLRDSLSDVGGGGMGNGLCDGTEECVYLDRITGLRWSKERGSSYSFTWEQAIDYCESLNYGGYSSGWRLPTAKEIMQAHIDGLWSLKSKLVSVNDMWTATTLSNLTSKAWVMTAHTGNTYTNDKTNAYRAICVR